MKRFVTTTLVIAMTVAATVAADGQSADKTVKQRAPNAAAKSSKSKVLNALGPSMVTINGRQIIVRKRNPDGSLALASPYVIRGVNWSPASQNTNTSKTDPNNAAIRRPEFGIWAATDIPLIKNMHANTVRTFIDPGLDATGMAVLDQLYDNGIMAVITVDDSNNDLTRVQQAVNFYKNHPAVIAWMVGSEWNINRYFGVASSVSDAAQRTERAAALIKSLDSNHPVMTSYGDIDINADGLRLADTQSYVNTICPSVDVWGLNIYRGSNFGTLFDQWQAITTKPMLLGEFGTDAFRSAALGAPIPGTLDGTLQAQWNQSEWNHLFNNLSANNPAKVAAGGFIFEWNDEWWKVSPPNSQQAEGFVFINSHPDDYANEEFFGIADIDRGLRSAYGAFTTAFDPAYQPPQTSTYRAISRGARAAEYDGQVGVAWFFANGAKLYQARGGGGGGRGFNVAAFDTCSGALRVPVQHFDTYVTRDSGGDGLNEMNIFLDSLPNGTLLLIAVADEAGLDDFPPNQCVHLSNAYIESFYLKLEALGSQQIRSYCYQDSYVLIAVKGEGVARAEQLSSGGEASGQATQSRSFSISPAGQSFLHDGGSGNVQITTGASCNWSATSSASWITINSSTSGAGNGVLNYSVDVDPDSGFRSGTITISDQTFSVIQSAATTALRIDSVIQREGRASGGQEIKLSGSFAGLSTVTMGGAPASWVYTNGGDTSSITVTTPAHAVGVVQIDLAPASGSGFSKANAFDFLPTVFTDDILMVGETTAKAQHIMELRQAIDTLRALAGLGAAPWTDIMLPLNLVVIKAVHIQELRDYFDDAATRLGFASQPYSEPVTAGIVIRKNHIDELRQRIRQIAG
jgi:hypothetical protein